MNKTKKLIILGVVIVIVVILGKPFLQGFSSSFTPSEALRMAERKKAENVNVYIPSGYAITTKAEARETDFGQIFLTDMENGTNLIRIMQGNKDNIECKGKTTNFGSTSTCLFDFGIIPSDPNNKAIKFDKGKSTYQMEINDKKLSNEEITKIIESL